MKRALALVMMLMLVGAGVVAADEFPLSTKDRLPAGNGWRVIHADTSHDPRWAFRVAVATSRDEWHSLWGDVAGRLDFAPYVNFDNSIVAVFGTGTNSCTASVRFDEVVFDKPSRLVHSLISETSTCMFLDLSGAAVFAVALSRSMLPASPFTLQLEPEPICGSCTDPPDSVTVDL